MGSLTTGALSLALVSAIAQPPSAFHPGVGAELGGLASTEPNIELHPPAAPQEQPTTGGTPPPPAMQFGASSRAPSYYERVQQSREAKIAHVSAALATQAAMIIYGVMRMVGQAKNARNQPPEKPYPFRR